MKNENKVFIRKLAEIQMEKGSCGMRRRLITEEDGDTLALSHLKISDAKRHYHKKTTELYYVLKGTGKLEVDSDSIPLIEGTLVLIKPGVAHKAISDGDLEVLIIMTPPQGETGDMTYINDLK